MPFSWGLRQPLHRRALLPSVDICRPCFGFHGGFVGAETRKSSLRAIRWISILLFLTLGGTNTLRRYYCRVVESCRRGLSTPKLVDGARWRSLCRFVCFTACRTLKLPVLSDADRRRRRCVGSAASGRTPTADCRRCETGKARTEAGGVGVSVSSHLIRVVWPAERPHAPSEIERGLEERGVIRSQRPAVLLLRRLVFSLVM